MANSRGVLVVEDDDFIRVAVAEALKDANFHVFEAANPADAIICLETNGNIEIVFSDIDLGSSSDGADLLRVIAERWPPIRLVATSGVVSHATSGRLPTGTPFFAKPYNHSAIINAFQAL